MRKIALTRRDFLAGATAVGVLAAFSLSGCTTNDQEESESTDEPNPTEHEPEEPSVLRAALASGASSMNPVGATSSLALAGGWHVFEGLYNLDIRTFKTTYGLADKDPVRITDTEYEVTLREDAAFSNGQRVTSNDIVNAFEQNMANESYAPILDFISAVAAKDETTVTFLLNYPFSTLLKNRLALVKIFPAEQTQEDLDIEPIGTGPWKYDEIDSSDGGLVVFSKNEYYNGSNSATCDEMQWSILLDPETRASVLINDDVSVIENAHADEVDDILEADATVEYVPGFMMPYLMFNTKKAPFNDKRVRQAIFYAIDIDKLIANCMGGRASAATSFLPETFANYHRAETVYTYDTTKAAELLTQAGVRDLSFELLIGNNWVNDFAEQIQGDLESMGITVTINNDAIDWTALTDAQDTPPFDVMLNSGDPSSLGNDPDLLISLWYGDTAWMQGCTGWAEDEAWSTLQNLLQQARTQTNETEQQEIWNSCFDLIADEAVLYPLFHREIATAYRADSLRGFSPISTAGLYLLNTTLRESTTNS